jgi:hypothetical protein
LPFDTLNAMLDDVEELFSASLLYVAVIGCDPAASEAIVNAARACPSRDDVPIEVAPSLNVTLPVGKSALPDTAAMNVTGDPSAAALDVVEIAVAVATFPTGNAIAADVLVPLFESPPYVAVKLCEPTLLNGTVMSAEPLASCCVAPICVPPSKNLTEPGPGADDPVTVAVSVTDCVGAADVGEALNPVELKLVPTFSMTDPAIPAALFASPLYVAVIVCGPLPRVPSVALVVPPESAGGAPKTVPPFRKVTVPVGAAPGLVTVAVYVTVAKGVDGFGTATTVVVAVACEAVKATVADDAPLFEEPPYAATMVCDAPERLLTVTDAWPLPSRAGFPTELPLSLN